MSVGAVVAVGKLALSEVPSTGGGRRHVAPVGLDIDVGSSGLKNTPSAMTARRSRDRPPWARCQLVEDVRQVRGDGPAGLEDRRVLHDLDRTLFDARVRADTLEFADERPGSTPVSLRG